MNSLVVGLVIASTFMHAGWNLLARRKGSAEACLGRMQWVIIAAGIVPAAAAWAWLRCISWSTLLCLAGSGAGCAFYYACLGRAYATADFTTVYPTARALPVLLLGIADALRGRSPNVFGWLGMALVGAGCLATPLTSFSDLSPRHYLRRSMLWIVFTALGTVAYSFFDKIGTESIPRGPLQSALYCYLFFLSTGLCYAPLQRLLGSRTAAPCEVGWRTPAAMAALNFLSYWLILWAFQMTTRASYVVAFRQFSIVIGVAVAVIAFRESGRFVRLAGALVITAGLVVLKVWGG